MALLLGAVAATQRGRIRGLIDGEQPSDEASSYYQPKPLIGGETTPAEAHADFGPGEPLSIALGDGTSVVASASDGPLSATLARESNSRSLDGTGQQPTGSMRILTIDSAPPDEPFVPLITIPAREAGDVVALNAARIGDLLVDGEVLHDAVRFLPVERDAAGNVLVRDVFFALAAPLATVSRQPAGSLASTSGSVASEPVETRQAAIVLSTYQEQYNWKIEPRLVRMVPDASLTGSFRVPLASLSVAEQERELSKPIRNVLILVHGHNEAEKRGNEAHETGEPWLYNYKHDVWTYMYEALAMQSVPGLEEASGPFYTDCTAIYEFIYPTYRSIFGTGLQGVPTIEQGGVPSLAESFAAALRNDPLIHRLVESKQVFNLSIVAHSMGGVVARAGMNEFDLGNEFDRQLINFAWDRLITWGSPHHGLAVVTLRALLGAGIDYQAVAADEFGRGGFTVPLSTLRNWRFYQAGVESLAADTPGERDLRWDDADQLHVSRAGWQIADGQGWNVIYSADLHNFNISDRYRNSDKYIAVMGVTSKTVPELDPNGGVIDTARFILNFQQASEIAKGNFLTHFTFRDESPVTIAGEKFAMWDNDGAVPVTSMSGLGIIRPENVIYLGDVDHEEYFGAPAYPAPFTSAARRIDLARQTAGTTLELLGFTGIAYLTSVNLPDVSHLVVPDCRCPQVTIENPANGQHIAADGSIDVTGRLVWPGVDPAADSARTAAVRDSVAGIDVLIDGTTAQRSQGNDQLATDLSYRVPLDLAKVPSGSHALVVQLRLRDETTVVSAAVAFTLGAPAMSASCFASETFDVPPWLMPPMNPPWTAPPISWACAYPPSGDEPGRIYFFLAVETSSGMWDAWTPSVPYDGSGSFSSDGISGIVTPGGITVTVVDEHGTQEYVLNR